MKKVLFFIFILLLSMFSAAAEKKPDFNIWLNTGIGIGTSTVQTESAAAVVGLSGIYNNFAATLRYALNSDEKSYCGNFSGVSCKDSPREDYGERAYIDEKSIIVGFGGFNDFGAFTFGSGISHVYRREKEVRGQPVEKKYTFGIPFELQVNVKGTEYFSCGAYSFYNFNDVKSFGGFMFTLQVGYLK